MLSNQSFRSRRGGKRPSSLRLAAVTLGAVLVLAALLAGTRASVLLAGQRRQAPASVQPSFYPFSPPEKLPAITDSSFLSVADADNVMQPAEPVLGVSYGGEARAYSVWQLERSLVVNDTILGRPIAVTWCPLSHTAVVFDRRVAGKVLTFEPDGRVFNDAIVLRDRETATSWTQQDGVAVEGPQTGARLGQLPVLQTSWKEWKAEEPRTVALDKGKQPAHSSLFAEYEADSSKMGLGHVVLNEPRMGGKALVVAVVSGSDRIAVPLLRVKDQTIVNVMVDHQRLAMLYDAASDTVRVVRTEARGDNVSLRRGPPADLYGRRLDPYLIDEETASRWDLTGRCIQGRMADQRLKLVPYRCEYWYAWQAYFPKSRVE